MPRNNPKKNKYRSLAEQNVADWLENRKINYDYERIKLDYISPVRSGICSTCGGTKSVGQKRKYTGDFWIPLAGGDPHPLSGILLEVKGRLTSTDRSKMRDVKRANPSWDIRFLFLANNKINPRSHTRYSHWAEEHGFPYCIGSLDPSWFRPRAVPKVPD